MKHNKNISVRIVQGTNDHAIYRDGELVAVKPGDGVGIPAIMESLKTAGLYQNDTDKLPKFDMHNYRLTDETSGYTIYFSNLIGRIAAL